MSRSRSCVHRRCLASRHTCPIRNRLTDPRWRHQRHRTGKRRRSKREISSILKCDSRISTFPHERQFAGTAILLSFMNAIQRPQNDEYRKLPLQRPTLEVNKNLIGESFSENENNSGSHSFRRTLLIVHSGESNLRKAQLRRHDPFSCRQRLL